VLGPPFVEKDGADQSVSVQPMLITEITTCKIGWPIEVIDPGYFLGHLPGGWLQDLPPFVAGGIDNRT
jgi:hypothetical protein